VEIEIGGSISDANLAAARVVIVKAVGQCDPGALVDDLPAVQGTGPGEVDQPTRNVLSSASSFELTFRVGGGISFNATDFCVRVEAQDSVVGSDGAAAPNVGASVFPVRISTSF
jgi:hypothetical protein